MEETNKKTIEQSGVRKGSPIEGVGVYGIIVCCNLRNRGHTRQLIELQKLI